MEVRYGYGGGEGGVAKVGSPAWQVPPPQVPTWQKSQLCSRASAVLVSVT